MRIAACGAFAAKLDFTLGPGKRGAAASLGPLIKTCRRHALSTSVKLFRGARSSQLRAAARVRLLRYLFRDTQATLENPSATRSWISSDAALRVRSTVHEDKTRNAEFLYACVPLVPIQALARRLRAKVGTTVRPCSKRAKRIVATQQDGVSAPLQLADERALEHAVRFGQAPRARVARLLEHKRFRAAYDFLVLARVRAKSIRRTVLWGPTPESAARRTSKQLLNVKRQGRRRRGGRRRGGRQHEMNDVVV